MSTYSVSTETVLEGTEGQRYYISRVEYAIAIMLKCYNAIVL